MRTLQNLAAQGAIPGAAKPAGRWTFDIAQLRQWARQTPENTLPCRKHLYRNGVYWGRFQVAGREYRKSLHVRVEPARRAEAKAVQALERIRAQIEERSAMGLRRPNYGKKR
jgi:hypothetical protein